MTLDDHFLGPRLAYVSATFLFSLSGVFAADDDVFDTATSLIPTDQIISGGVHKDGIPSLDDPAFVGGGAARYLKAGDLVVGLHMGGEAKAYPLRILVWHEVANDTVGGVPVAVTYCPLCHSTVVFHRNIGGQTRSFGVSGRLYNSNVLMYDRQSDVRMQSLWSQASMRAVTGPAAARKLTMKPLPAELTTWKDWAERYPRTLVLSDKTGHRRPYQRRAYADYFSSDRLMFPVHQEKERPRHLDDKDLMAVVYAGSAAKAYAVKDVKKASGKAGGIIDRVGDRKIGLIYIKRGDTLRVSPADDGPPLPVAYMFWFALSAMQPEVDLFVPPR